MVSSGASHDCEAHKIVHVVPQLATPQFGTPNEDLLKYNSSARRFAGSVLSAVPSQVPSLGLSDCLHVSFAAGSSLHGLPVSARLLSRCSPSSHSTKTNAWGKLGTLAWPQCARVTSALLNRSESVLASLTTWLSLNSPTQQLLVKNAPFKSINVQALTINLLYIFQVIIFYYFLCLKKRVKLL